MSEELPQEIKTLNIDNLRVVLQTKCQIINDLEKKIKFQNKEFSNLLKEEKEKNDELKTLIRLQKKEIEGNAKIITELQKEIFIWREKSNKIKESEKLNIKTNTHSNYFKSTEQKEEILSINDFNDIKLLNNQFSGDSEVSNYSKIESNNISKKWVFDQQNLIFNFDDLEIRFKKVIDLTKINKTIFMTKKEFQLINVEIYNCSNSILEINDLQLDATES